MDLINTELLPIENEISQIQEESIIYRILARIIDIIVGIFGTILLIPIIIFVFIINIIKNQNIKVFFVQKRIGKDGKLFNMYKFQTMVNDADEKLKNYLKENKEAKKEYKINKKLKNDPRITEIGKFLRKTSLDEFPQFINILKGEMRLVGPRPYLPREIEDMGNYYECIITCKPGLTGPWQISGRSNTTFEDRLLIDMEYINSKNYITKDIKIIFKTVVCAFKGHGAL